MPTVAIPFFIAYLAYCLVEVVFFSFISEESYPRFSHYLNYEMYTDLHWGLTSSVYAELLAISGYLGLFFVVLLLNTILFKFNLRLRNKGYNFYSLLLTSSFVYLAFYSHRVDITFILGFLKISFIIIILFKFLMPLKNRGNAQ